MEERGGGRRPRRSGAQDRELHPRGRRSMPRSKPAPAPRRWRELDALFAADDDARPLGRRRRSGPRCQAAHRGHQVGLELLLVIPRIGICVPSFSRSASTRASSRSSPTSSSTAISMDACIRAGPLPAAEGFGRRDRDADGRHLLRARGTAPAAADRRRRRTSRRVSRSSSSK